MSLVTLFIVVALGLGLVAAAACIIAVRERVKAQTLRQQLDRYSEWLAYMQAPRVAPKPAPLAGAPEMPLGKRDYEPNDDVGAIADLLEQTESPPDFFELAPEAEEAEMINIANRQPQQVGMEEPECERGA